ncbi:MAG: hypothetical protein RLY93_09305 [Sumerlaeia bacterium]
MLTPLWRAVLPLLFLGAVMVPRAAHAVPEVTYYLVDRSLSMNSSARDGRALLDHARSRALTSISRKPPIQDRRRVVLIFFDSDPTRANRIEIAEADLANVESLLATNFMARGKHTVVGARIEEIRRELLALRPAKAEIHLFSDLQENFHGLPAEAATPISLQAALDRLLGDVGTDRGATALLFYLYAPPAMQLRPGSFASTDSDGIEYQLEFPPDRVLFRDIARPLVEAFLDAPSATPVFRIAEERVGAATGAIAEVRLSGFLEPLLSSRGARLAIRGHLEIEDGQRFVLRLNDQTQLDVTPGSSRFGPMTVVAELPPAVPFADLESGARRAFVILEPILSAIPRPLEAEDVDGGVPLRVGARFAYRPRMEIAGHRGDETIAFNELLDGAPCWMDFELLWNASVEDEILAWRLDPVVPQITRLLDGAGRRQGQAFLVPTGLGQRRATYTLHWDNLRPYHGAFVVETAGGEELIRQPLAITTAEPRLELAGEAIAASNLTPGGKALVPFRLTGNNAVEGLFMPWRLEPPPPFLIRLLRGDGTVFPQRTAIAISQTDSGVLAFGIQGARDYEGELVFTLNPPNREPADVRIPVRIEVRGDAPATGTLTAEAGIPAISP